MNTDNIVLIGFMGTGKSTIAKKLSDRLGWRYVDSDQYIEAVEGTSIAEIFELKGEAYFRQLESKAIREIMQQKQQVVSTGGGAVLALENIQHMVRNGTVVKLIADPQIIINRVSRDRNRPLLKDDVKETVYRLLEQRKHVYDFAHLQIDTSTLSIDDIVGGIIKQL